MEKRRCLNVVAKEEQSTTSSTTNSTTGSKRSMSIAQSSLIASSSTLVKQQPQPENLQAGVKRERQHDYGSKREETGVTGGSESTAESEIVRDETVRDEHLCEDEEEPFFIARKLLRRRHVRKEELRKERAALIRKEGRSTSDNPAQVDSFPMLHKHGLLRYSPVIFATTTDGGRNTSTTPRHGEGDAKNDLEECRSSPVPPPPRPYLRVVVSPDHESDEIAGTRAGTRTPLFSFSPLRPRAKRARTGTSTMVLGTNRMNTGHS